MNSAAAPSLSSPARSGLQRARAALLVGEGLIQALALLAVARARPPLYGALLAVLVWVVLVGEPARALAWWLRGCWRSTRTQRGSASVD